MYLTAVQLKHSFIDRGKSFAVFAATATEKQEWMAHINKCIEVICYSLFYSPWSFTFRRLA